MHPDIPCFLADTWWYGSTVRLGDKDFVGLTSLRRAQGFSAIQMVVGIPPEVGPGHPSAGSVCGLPWDSSGRINKAYLGFARKRIEYLNQLGFLVILYGAWGYQIKWLGQDNMLRWWSSILEEMDDLNIVYCLTGEVNLWVGSESSLLPNKCTDDLVQKKIASVIPDRLIGWVRSYQTQIKARWLSGKREERRRGWDVILRYIAAHTLKPIILHTEPCELADQALPSSHLLSANTAQTGHDPGSRDRLWALPLHAHQSGKHFINLEPWYEGITGRFGLDDQLYAYWVTMLAGASAYCYGAQGIWNVGDGAFLSHWGNQSFAEAMALDTPRLIGLSHKEFISWNASRRRVEVDVKASGLSRISCQFPTGLIHYFPEIADVKNVPEGMIWVPRCGCYKDALPGAGQVVIFQSMSTEGS